MSSDPFGRALRDHYLGRRDEPLVYRDGREELEHPIERLYFGEYPADGTDERAAWLESRLEGPLLDMGAGIGRHALYFQDRFEVVAIETSEHLVETMRDRGVDDARCVDMFSLRDAFERDRFRSALAHGTQLGLARSMTGLRRFLDDLAFVTAPQATAVLDGYDPEAPGTRDLLGYRSDPTPGLAFRVLTFEYEDEVSETLLFRLFSPDRIREATVGTEWESVAVEQVPGEDAQPHYRVALTKEQVSGIDGC